MDENSKQYEEIDEHDLEASFLNQMVETETNVRNII